MLARMLQAEKRDNDKLGIGSRRRGDEEPEVDDEDRDVQIVEDSYISSSMASSEDFHAALEAQKRAHQKAEQNNKQGAHLPVPGLKMQGQPALGGVGGLGLNLQGLKE